MEFLDENKNRECFHSRFQILWFANCQLASTPHHGGQAAQPEMIVN